MALRFAGQTDSSEDPTILMNFTMLWSRCYYSSEEIMNACQKKCPVIVRIGDKFDNFDIRTLRDGMCFFVNGYKTQKRALVICSNGEYFSLPLDLPCKLLLDEDTDDSCVYQQLTFETLGESLNESPKLPAKFELQKSLPLGRDNAKAGLENITTFEVLHVFDEVYLLGHEIYKDHLLLERMVTSIPDGAPITMGFCTEASTEIDRRNLEDLERIFARAALGVDYSKARPPLNAVSYGCQHPQWGDKGEPSVMSAKHYIAPEDYLKSLPVQDSYGHYLDLLTLTEDAEKPQEILVVKDESRKFVFSRLPEFQTVGPNANRRLPIKCPAERFDWVPGVTRILMTNRGDNVRYTPLVPAAPGSVPKPSTKKDPKEKPYLEVYTMTTGPPDPKAGKNVPPPIPPEQTATTPRLPPRNEKGKIGPPGVEVPPIIRHKSGGQFTNLDSVPQNIAALTVKQVSQCLSLLKLQDFIEAFEKDHVDGEMLLELNSESLQEHFGIDTFKARQLVRFAEGWRPRYTVRELDKEKLEKENDTEEL